MFPDSEVNPVNKKSKQIYQWPIPFASMNLKERGKCFLETCLTHMFLVLMYLVNKDSSIYGIDVWFHAKILICPIQQILVCP
jgi:hypothetical protein